MATQTNSNPSLSTPASAKSIASIVSGSAGSAGLGTAVSAKPAIGTPEWDQANAAAKAAVMAKNAGLGKAAPLPDQPSSTVPVQTQTYTPAPAPSAMPPIGSTTYTGEVANRVDYLLNSDSPLMKRAETTGIQLANRRGLGNSSMAAGEAQKAVIDAATPIASQDSAQENQRTITSMNNASSERVAQMQIDAAAALAERESDLKLTLANIERDTSLTLQEKKVLADKELAAFQADKQQALAELDAATRTTIADKEITANRSLAEFNAEQQAQQQQRQLDAAAGQSELDRQSRASLQTQQLDAAAGQSELDRQSRASLQTQQIQADDARSDKAIAASSADAAAARAAAQQQQIAQALSDMSSQRFQALSNTLADSKIKADARGQIISSINDQYQSTVNYLQNLYGVSLNNSNPRLAA